MHAACDDVSTLPTISSTHAPTTSRTCHTQILQHAVSAAHAVHAVRAPQLDTSDNISLDKAVVTTMPQLSSAALVGCAVSLTAARLFALLADGNVHVWQLHLRRPPSFVVGGRGSDGEGTSNVRRR